MPFTLQGNFAFLHANQPDNLSSVMSANQIKSSFDSQALELKTTLNGLITALGSTAANNSGAENIGIEPIAGVTGANIQDGLQSLKGLIDTNATNIAANTTALGTKLNLTGGTISGTLVVTGTISEGGTLLSSKYLLQTGGTISGALTVTGILLSNNSVRADVTPTGQTTLVLKNSTDDSYLRHFTTGANLYLSSSNYASTASKNLLITGYSGNNMAKLSLLADDVTIAGTITASGAISEQGTTLANKYLAKTGGTVTGNITMVGDITGTGYTADFTSLREDGVRVNQTYLKLAGGTLTGTLTGTTINATTLQEGGTNLASKYLALTGGTLVGSLTISNAGAITFTADTTTNNGRIRFTSTASSNQIQSGDTANVAKNLTIGGTGGTPIPDLNVAANIFRINSQPLQSGMVTIVPVANTPTKATVTFPTAYSSPPHVVATGESAVIGSQLQGVSVANITNTTVDIYIYRTNTNSTNVHWIAMA